MRYPANISLAANCSTSLAAIFQPLRGGGESELDLALKQLSLGGLLIRIWIFSMPEIKFRAKHATFLCREGETPY